jgi:hypothetical protein
MSEKTPTDMLLIRQAREGLARFKNALEIMGADKPGKEIPANSAFWNLNPSERMVGQMFLEACREAGIK